MKIRLKCPACDSALLAKKVFSDGTRVACPGCSATVVWRNASKTGLGDADRIAIPDETVDRKDKIAVESNSVNLTSRRAEWSTTIGRQSRLASAIVAAAIFAVAIFAASTLVSTRSDAVGSGNATVRPDDPGGEVESSAKSKRANPIVKTQHPPVAPVFVTNAPVGEQAFKKGICWRIADNCFVTAYHVVAEAVQFEQWTSDSLNLSDELGKRIPRVTSSAKIIVWFGKRRQKHRGVPKGQNARRVVKALA